MSGDEVRVLPGSVGASGRLGKIMAATSDELGLAFQRIREAFDHAGTKGTAGEAVVADFLEARLPASVGITTGQIITSEGVSSSELSGQEDVILYDRQSTPLLFNSPDGSISLVPVEGVIAVVEVKTRLKREHLAGCVSHCRRIKQMRRTAYFPIPFKYTYSMYGQSWEAPAPIYYTVFAAEHDNLYAEDLNVMQEDVPSRERIDTIGYLGRAFGANADLSLDGGGELAHSLTYRGTSSGGLIDIESDNALLLWFAGLSAQVAQAQIPPIDLGHYMRDEMRVENAALPPTLAAKFRERALDHIANKTGLRKELLEKFGRGRIENIEDAYELLSNPSYQLPGELAEQAPVMMAVSAARQMSKEDWVARWRTMFSFPGPEGPIVDEAELPGDATP